MEVPDRNNCLNMSHILLSLSDRYLNSFTILTAKA